MGAGPDRALTARWCATRADAACAIRPLHDDVTFVGPLATVEGIDDYVRGLHGLKEIVKAAETQQVIADGDDVCIIYDLVAAAQLARTAAGAFRPARRRSKARPEG